MFFFCHFFCQRLCWTSSQAHNCKEFVKGPYQRHSVSERPIDARRRGPFRPYPRPKIQMHCLCGSVSMAGDTPRAAAPGCYHIRRQPHLRIPVEIWSLHVVCLLLLDLTWLLGPAAGSLVAPRLAHGGPRQPTGGGLLPHLLSSSLEGNFGIHPWITACLCA